MILQDKLNLPAVMCTYIARMEACVSLVANGSQISHQPQLTHLFTVTGKSEQLRALLGRAPAHIGTTEMRAAFPQGTPTDALRSTLKAVETLYTEIREVGT